MKVFDVFPIVITGFINKERQGIGAGAGRNSLLQISELIKECINAVESCFYDY
jgi:hypothetical protein